MERLLHYRARASPAFMLLMYNEMGIPWDPLNAAMDLFYELQLMAKREREVNEAYLKMAEQCETFALQLLQEVRSSSELADLMRYDLDDDPDDVDDPGDTDRIIVRRKQKSRNYLKPIEKAVKYKMKDFVTSDNSQLALIYIQKGSLFRKLKGYKATAVQVLLGLIYPLLCLGVLIAPNSKFGRLMSNPTVKFGCSVVSEIVFVLMLLVNTILSQTTDLSAGGQIPTLLMVAYIWILGKFYQEVREIYHQGIKEYLSDEWNWNDMITILLFSGYMGLRLYYLLTTGNQVDSHFFWHTHMFEPIPLSDICISISYILIHLRILELLRADRRFGPLQVSLDLMTKDAIRFFVIFFIIYLAFGSGICELYASFGTGKGCVCRDIASCQASVENISSTTISTTSVLTPNENCIPCKTNSIEDQMLTTWNGTFVSLYWTLFGYSADLRENVGITNCNENYFLTELVGSAIIYLYHIIAILVLVNMLIAMMSNSFQETHDDAEREWKFHRTQLWLKFIRNDITQPPPMNLIPQPKQIRQVALASLKPFKMLFCKRSEQKDENATTAMKLEKRRTGTSEALAGTIWEGETRYSKVLRMNVIRYLKAKVLKNEMVV